MRWRALERGALAPAVAAGPATKGCNDPVVVSTEMGLVARLAPAPLDVRGRARPHRCVT